MADDTLFKYGLLGSVVVLVYLAATGGLGGAPAQVAVTTPAGAPSTGGLAGAQPFCNVEDVTVTFSGIDKYSEGTTVSQGHRALKFDGAANKLFVDGGTATYSVGADYIVLLGNATQNVSTWSSYYYPQLMEGALPCDGTADLTGKLVKAGGIPQLTFTYWDKQGTANTVQAVAASADNTQKVQWTTADNVCFGNPYALEKSGKGNLICAYYNTTAYTLVEVLDESGATLSLAPTPKSMAGIAGNSISCYDTKKVFCDNADNIFKVHYKAANNEITDGSNITLALSDITIGYNTDTLAVIYGYEDAPNRNDLGVSDFGKKPAAFEDSNYNIKLS